MSEITSDESQEIIEVIDSLAREIERIREKRSDIIEAWSNSDVERMVELGLIKR